MQDVEIYKMTDSVTLVTQNPDVRRFIESKIPKEKWAMLDVDNDLNSPIIINPDFYIPLIGFLKTNRFKVAVNGK